MAKLTDAIAIKLEGTEDMRRLSAALERHNEGGQILGARERIAHLEIHASRLTAERDELRAELDRARVVAAADLETLRSRDAQIDQMAADLAKLTSRASIAEAASRAKDKELAEALDRLAGANEQICEQNAALKFNRDQVEILQRESITQQAATLEAIAMMEGRRSSQLNQAEVNIKLLRTVSELMRVLESQPVKVNELRRQLAEANDTITKQTDVIKELHKQYHELEARKMATQYDLDRANDEIAAAEAEIAKYKPLVEAVRRGFVYGSRGKWVRVTSATVADINDGLAVSFFIPNSEDPQCL